MKELSRFQLPLTNLDLGSHEYRFDIDSAFFASRENPLIKEGQLEARATLEVGADVIVVKLQHEGYIATACDRCLEAIKLPVKGSGEILVKVVDVPKKEDEVVYLQRDHGVLDLAPMIDEVVSLTLPMVKTYDCHLEEVPPCNQEVLNRLRQTEETNEGSSAWDELKRLKLQ